METSETEIQALRSVRNAIYNLELFYPPEKRTPVYDKLIADLRKEEQRLLALGTDYARKDAIGKDYFHAVSDGNAASG